ncbi:MAG: hypothetical protein LBT94_00110, partial [Prevotellaceae bacterium]|nr:hypothetical protein [Prevotellaceae bacterium]
KSAEEGALRDTMARIEVQYGVAFEWDFLATDYEPVGVGEALSYAKTADYAAILRVVQYIEKNVFCFFPESFIKEYMPRNIFLVDSLISVYRHEDAVNEVSWQNNRAITGNITDKYLALGNVNERFNPTLALQEELLSLFIEYLFNNNRMPPVPEGIKAATEKAATDVGAIIYTNPSRPNSNYPYLDGRYTTWAGTGDDSTATPWLGRGILKMGRIGMTGYSRDVIYGIDLRSYSVHRGTLAQDLADFAAFILLHSPNEREAFYAQVEADSRAYTYVGYPPDPRFPYGGPAGAAAMRAKDAVAQSYLKEVFGN